MSPRVLELKDSFPGTLFKFRWWKENVTHVQNAQKDLLLTGKYIYKEVDQEVGHDRYLFPFCHSLLHEAQHVNRTNAPSYTFRRNVPGLTEMPALLLYCSEPSAILR